LAAQGESLRIGGISLPLERDVAVDALAAAIGAIANKSAIPSGAIPALAAWAAEASATPAAKSAAPTSTESSSASSAWARAARTSRSARNATGLPFDARSWESARSLYTQNWASQPEIILSGLQPVAQRSVDQERLVGVPWRLGRSILGR
jgi:hypothetical protein